MPDLLVQYLDMALPLVAAMLTVPLMDWLKKVQTWVGRLSPTKQRFVAATIAFVITVIGEKLNVMLPTDLQLITPDKMEAAASAAMAFAIHAAQKAKSVTPNEPE